MDEGIQKIRDFDFFKKQTFQVPLDFAPAYQRSPPPPPPRAPVKSYSVITRTAMPCAACMLKPSTSDPEESIKRRGEAISPLSSLQAGAHADRLACACSTKPQEILASNDPAVRNQLIDGMKEKNLVLRDELMTLEIILTEQGETSH